MVLKTLSQKNVPQKRAQGVGLEFKPQCHKNKTKQKPPVLQVNK
jgi:hypothetical protein